MFRGGYVTPGKLANIFRCACHAVEGKVNSTGYPPVYTIDPSASCNLGCFVCPAGNARPDPRLKMPMDAFVRLTDEVAPKALAFFLYVIGEPFMNKRLPDMIAYAHRKRIYTIVSTNGHFLPTVAHAERLVSSGLDDLIVSISGLNQETYARYHRRGDVERVKRNIRNLVAAKRKCKSARPWITVRYIQFDYNRHEREPARRYFRDLGVNAFDWRHGRERYAVESMPDRLPDVVAQYEERYLGARHATQGRGKRCFWPWFISVVNCDGSVAVCCQYPWIERESDPNCMGNAFTEKGFNGVWEGHRMQRFRRAAHSGKGLPHFCRECIRGLSYGDET